MLPKGRCERRTGQEGRYERGVAACRYSEEAGVEDVALLKDAAASSGGDPVEATQGDAQNAITEVGWQISQDGRLWKGSRGSSTGFFGLGTGFKLWPAHTGIAILFPTILSMRGLLVVEPHAQTFCSPMLASR